MGVLKSVVAILFCLIIPALFQGVGFFKNDWATRQNLTCSPVKLYWNSIHCPEEFYSEFVLQALSTSVLMMFAISYIVTDVCRRRESDNPSSFDSIISICQLMCCTNVFLFPFAGILSLSGCIMVSTHFPTSDLGPSFTWCLIAGCIHILGMLYIIVNVCRQICNHEEEDTTVTVQPSYDVVPSVSQTVSYSGQSTAVRVTEEAVAIETEHGVLFAMRRKIEFVQSVF